MKRVRRRKSKEIRKLITPYALSMKVYNSLLTNIATMLDSIYIQQQTCTGSPNFFYKGDIYIKVPKVAVTPLDDTLRTDMDTYLKVFKETSSHVDTFKFALVKFISEGNTLSDLYYLLPYKHHHYLEDVEFVEKPDDHVAKIQGEDHTDILELIQEQALYDLIG